MSGPRICVYTALTGGYDALLDQPVAHESGADFLCFTDAAELSSETWKVVHQTRRLAHDPVRSARATKILGHDLLRTYDVTLYVDASVLLLQPPERLVADWLPDDVDLALPRHSYRAQVIDEFDAVLAGPLDDPARVHEQLLHYAQVHADVLSVQPCWSAILVRRNTSPVHRTMQTWWEHVLRYSRRDQLSLMVALDGGDVRYRALELDNRESEYHRWPVAPERRHDVRYAPQTSGSLVAEVRRQSLRIAELEGQVSDLKRLLRRTRRRLKRAQGSHPAS